MRKNELVSCRRQHFVAIDQDGVSDPSSQKKPNKHSIRFARWVMAVGMLFLGSIAPYAQVNLYSFAESSGAYSEITGGTIIATANANTGSAPGSMDSYNSAAITLPFTFTFNGNSQTTAYMNGNGYMTFGAAPSTFTSTPISSTNVYNGAVSAWGGDLNFVFNIGGRTGEMRWETIGSAPNREIVFQWKNIRPAYSSSTTSAYTFSFQIRLIETSNEVKVVYGPGSFAIGSTAVTGTSNRQIGLRGATNAVYNNRTWTSFSSASVAGTANSSANSFSTATNFPASGKTLTWTPPAPCAGTPTPGNTIASVSSGLCPGSTTNLSLQTATTGSGVTYQWKSSADGVTYNNILGATSATYTASVLSNTFYMCDVICSGSTGTSNPIQVTTNAPISSFPWNEGFETLPSAVGTTTFPTCWNETVGTQWATANAGSDTYTDPRTGTNYLRLTYGPAAATVWTPGFTLTAGNVYSFNGYIMGDNLAGWTTTEVVVNTAPAAAGITVVGANLTPTGTLPTSYSAFNRYFTCPATGTYYFGLRATGTSAPWYLGFDDISVDVVPACAGTPNAGTISGTTASCANVNFTLTAAGLTPDLGASYQWQNSTDGGTTWNDIAGATGLTLTAQITANTKYRVVSTCSYSTLTNTSPEHTITLLSGACACATYTIISASSTADEELTSVTVGTMTNTSACNVAAPGAGSVANRYANFTGSVAGPTVAAGASVNFSLTQTSCGGAFGHGYQIYVDWNQNGSFADAGEQMYSSQAASGTVSTSTQTGSFTVPVTALGGSTRMRVIVVEVGFPTTTNYATTAYTYGETEDYCFTVIPPPATPGAPSADGSTNCLSGSVLTAASAPAGVTNYWQTTATGTDLTNSAATTTVYSNGTYYIRAYEAATTLWSIASASVTVSSFPVETAPTAISAGANPACTTTDLTVGAAPTDVLYYWQGTNPTAASTASPATSPLTVTANGTYAVRALNTVTGCWSNATTITVAVYAAPNATVAFNSPFNCATTNGSIVFNATGAGTVFNSDFSTPTLPAGTVSAGNDFSASDNGRMRLTSNVVSKSGGVLIPNNTGLAANDFAIDFDLITISNGGVTADGVSYSYGPDVVAMPSNTAVQAGIGLAATTGVATLAPENGSGTGLKLAFDAIANTGGCPVANGAVATLPNTSIGNSPGVYLMYNNTTLHQGSNCSGVLYFSNDVSWRASGVAGNTTSTHVTIKINASQVSMWLNGVLVVNQVSLPAGYSAADKSTWKHAFAARTGGLAQGHYIDNLNIRYNLYEYSVDGGTTWVNDSPVSVAPGNYDTKVRYSTVTSCVTSTGTGTIAALAAPTVTVTGPSLICNSASFTLTGSYTYGGSNSDLTFQWEKSTDAGLTWTAITGATAATYTGTQTVNTQYRINTTWCGGAAYSSSAYTLNLDVPTNCYCTPIYTTGKTAGDLISQVSITGTTLNNNSGTTPVNPSYTFFQGQPNYTCELNAASSYQVVVTIGSFTNQGLAAWIDYNDDGIFSASEKIGNTTSAILGAFGTGTFNINIACTPPVGTHRLRIREVYANAGPTIDPCISYAYGETEDYLVTILPAVPFTPSFTAEPAAAVCTQEQVTYTTQASQATYSWTIPGIAGTDYTLVSGGTGTNNTAVIKWITGGSKEVFVNYTNASGCTSTGPDSTTSVANVAPVVTITADVNSLCGVAGTSNITATNDLGVAASNYTWTTNVMANGTLSATTGGTVVASIPTVTDATNFVYTATIIDPATSCAGSAQYTIVNFAFPAFSATVNGLAIPTDVCPNTSVNLSAGLSAGAFSVSTTSYNWESAPSVGTTNLVTAGVATTPFSIGSYDDGAWYSQPIGFDFDFFGTNYTNFQISTNGFLQFTPGNQGSVTDYSFPNALPTALEPTNAIFVCAGDWFLSGSLRYWTVGSTPTRKLIVEYDTPGLGGNGFVKAQAHIFETTGIVEIHVQEASSLTAKTVGVQNAAGTIGSSAPGFNASTATNWNNNAWRFNPPVTYTYAWTANNGSTVATATTELTTSTPNVGVNTYSVAITNPISGCVKNDDVIITVQANPTPTFTSSIPASPCNGFPVTYTTQAGMLNYSWNITDEANAALVYGTDYTATGNTSGSNSAVITWLTAGSRKVSVNYANALGCTSTGAVDTIVNVITTVPGSLLFTANAANTGGTVTYNASGAIGSIAGGWQKSIDGGTTWTAISPNGPNSYTYNNLTVETKFRVLVTNGTCSTLPTNVITGYVPGAGVANAVAVNTIGQFGTGVQTSYTTNLANVAGNEVWYTFTAAANAARISVVGSGSVADDNQISLYDGPASNPMIPILTENDVVTGAQGAAADAGSEILLTDQLIPGNQYYFSVKNNNATAGQVSIVISYLRSSEADIMPYTSYTGVYNNTCQNFKAKFRANSTGYTVKRWADQTEANTAVATGAGTPSWVYAIPAGTGTVASTICQLGRILPANILSGSALTYYVTVDAAYNLADAFGNMNALTAAGSVVSAVGLNSEADLNVRVSDRCPAFKSATTGSITTNRSVCGVRNYDYEFAKVLPTVDLPINVAGPVGGSRVLALNTVAGIGNGQTYDVRIRGKHVDNATNSNYGTVACVKTTGVAGMPTIEDEGVIAERSFNGVTTSIYPNPNNGSSVNLNVDGMEGELQVRITDATGRMVYSNRYIVEGAMNTTMDFGQTLAGGVYMVEMVQNGQLNTMRMVVNR